MTFPKTKLITDNWFCKTVAVEGWQDTWKHLKSHKRLPCGIKT